MATIKPVYGEDVAVFDRRGDDRKSYRIAFKLPQSVLAPLSADQQIGIAEIMMGGNLVATVPLVAPSAVPSKPSLMQRLLGRR